MTKQHSVDFEGRDFLAAAIDQLLDPAGEEQESLFIQAALIARVEPSAGVGLFIGLGVVQVAGSHIRAADAHLANGALGDWLVGGWIQNGELHGTLGTPNTTRFVRAKRGEGVGRHLVRGLGHGVRLQDRHLEGGLQSLKRGGSEGGRAGADEAERRRRGRSGVVLAGAGEQDLVDGGHGGVEGGGVGGGVGPEDGGAEATLLREDGGAAAGQRREQARHQAVHVEQRHDQVRAVRGR
mmetsp:Transcript_16862/g.30571  ORF Transcript_16862/g.30571 Transcript_16862/m.30571 type:complete len:238 (-) Transcript_16862:632-1345(-)